MAKIEEVSLIGSTIKGFFTGAGKEKQYVKDVFLKDFIQDAMVTINTAKKGTIAPPKNKAAVTPPSVDAEPASNKSQKPTISAIDKAFGNVVSNMRKIKSGTKPVPSNITNSLLADIKNSRYNKDWAIKTGNSILSLAQKGYNVNDLTKNWNATAAIGKKLGTVQENENKYDTLNKVFENIVTNISEQDQSKQQLSDLLLDWFTAYMQGVNWSSKASLVKEKIQNIQDLYDQGKNYKNAIKDLGTLAFVASKSSVKMPAGMDNVINQGSDTDQKSKSATQKAVDPNVIKQQLAALYASNPSEFKRVLQDVLNAVKGK